MALPRQKIEYGQNESFTLKTISGQTISATINDADLKLVDSYEYLGLILNNIMNYDAQWEVTPTKTNHHIYLLK